MTPGAGRFAFGQTSIKVRAARTIHVTVKPTARGAALVAKHHSMVLIRLVVLFTPTGGVGRAASVGGILVAP